MDPEINAIEVLDQVEEIVRAASDEIVVESRLEETLEIYESIRFEQESINFVDRLRNTEGDLQITMNSRHFPLIVGEVRFTSDDYLVITNHQAEYFISSREILLINQVDRKAVFRIDPIAIETTTLWIKNLIDQQSLVSVTLQKDFQLTGQIIRFGHDHLDFLVDQKSFLIPLAAIVVIRRNREN